MNKEALRWIPEAIQYAVDPKTGCIVEQLTSDAVLSNNIYCEQRYTNDDGSLVVFTRVPFGQPAQIWICRMDTLRIAKIVDGVPSGANCFRNVVYYQIRENDRTVFMRLDLKTLESTRLFDLPGERYYATAISPDEQRVLCGPFVVPGHPRLFALKRINLADNAVETICTVEDMFNPHVQFNPGNPRDAMIQINRGGNPDPGKDMRTFIGPLGATLAHLDVETGTVTPLASGRPWTPGCTGHETWIGTTGQLAFTACHVSVSSSSFVTWGDIPAGEEWMPSSAIYAVGLGDNKPRIIANGLLFNHIAISEDGQFFVAEDNTDMRIYIGNVRTGKYLGLCDSHTRQGSCQHSHVHPYMTPDQKFIIFNSIATGVPQVYAARIPDGFLDQLRA